MGKYRKKPVVIEAMKFYGDHDNCLECYNWVNGVTERTPANIKKVHDHVFENGGIIITTLEGDMKACFGDYIIKGVQGEFYPCKPDIFEATYEKANTVEMNLLLCLSTIQKRENLNKVFAVDEKGPGNANHAYHILSWESGQLLNEILFQKGARKDSTSIHGVLDSDLIEIVRDRLKGFQSGEFATRENALALTHIEEALMWMNHRVEERIERNVLGTYKK